MVNGRMDLMSEKIKDEKGRWRNYTVAFRVSPEEWEGITEEVRLSGYETRQQFICDSLLHHEIKANGNPVMFLNFKKDLEYIYAELRRIERKQELDERWLDTLEKMLQIMESFEKKNRRN